MTARPWRDALDWRYHVPRQNLSQQYWTGWPIVEVKTWKPPLGQTVCETAASPKLPSTGLHARSATDYP